MYFLEYEHFKRFVWKEDNIFAYKLEDWQSGKFSKLAVIGAFCRCAMAEKRISLHIFFLVIF